MASVRDRLVTFRDERGRELINLPGAPRPEPEMPATVRFLTAFHYVVLGYQYRTRIIDDAHRGLSVAGARFVLVDGRVSATWTVEDDAVVVRPLRRFSRSERAEVVEEGKELAAFLVGERKLRSPAKIVYKGPN
ncbi:DNA glycosylase AlkZ-like family protein [Amycolatopsis acidicola]|uniref:DNA glycosylase AlkZ-like family protein n=1 Tax=Amycolatopsis acidicola TaxID=2596893 RepID=UPI003C7A2AAC